jgi:hypothetical protein
MKALVFEVPWGLVVQNLQGWKLFPNGTGTLMSISHIVGAAIAVEFS